MTTLVIVWCLCLFGYGCWCEVCQATTEEQEERAAAEHNRIVWFYALDKVAARN